MAAALNHTKNAEEQLVHIRLPYAEDAGEGLRADPFEQVTIDGRVWNIRRGECVDVPPCVFLALREKYPDL